MRDYASMTPGCSCKGLAEATETVKRLAAEREHYRDKALEAACQVRAWSDDAVVGGCCDDCKLSDGTYCDAVIKEVDA